MQITISQDDRIRLIGSVLLFTDLVNENGQFRPHPLKTLSLEYLEPYASHPCIAAARSILTKGSVGSEFIVYAVFLGGTCERFAFNPSLVPRNYDWRYIDCFAEKGFPALLWDYLSTTDIRSFWDKTSDLWEEVLRDCRGQLSRHNPGPFLETVFGTSALNLLVVPNPLSPAGFGYGPNDGSNSYAIMGPPQVSRKVEGAVSYALMDYMDDFLFHEFSHSMLSEAETAAPEAAEALTSIDLGMPSNDWFKTIYETAQSRVDELVIRAATALYDLEKGDAAGAMAYLDRQEAEYGLAWIRSAFEALRDYLSDRKRGLYSRGLSEYLPALASRIRRQY